MRSRTQAHPFSSKQLSLLPFLLVTLICQYTVTSENNPQERVFKRFESEIYPLMTRAGEDSCVSCHDPDTSSHLVFIGNARDDFQMLLDQHYFSIQGPDTILARLETTNSKKRMPKGKSVEPWMDGEIEMYRVFLNEVREAGFRSLQDDESFPSVLLNPFQRDVPPRDDNQFITYSQLKGKVQTLFEDSWVRAGKDLFEENVAFFNGADFDTRFNESNQATSSFLTGLDMMARDVGARAYRNRTGPFSRHPLSLPMSIEQTEASPAFRKVIEELYERLLYRAPKPHEWAEAYGLIRGIYQAEQMIQKRDYELTFRLTAHDPSTGLQAEEYVQVDVSADPLGLHQEWVDQSRGRLLTQDEKGLQMTALNRPLRFRAKQKGQRILVHRLEVGERVSLAAIGIESMDGEQVSVVGVTHSSVFRDGAWKLSNQGGLTSLEHEKVAIGHGLIEVPIEVEVDGDYKVFLIWRAAGSLSKRVLIEAYSESPNLLASPPPSVVPEKGFAHFNYDSSEDARSFAPVPAQFRFSDKDYVEVNNKGTDQKVTIGAVSMVPDDGKEPWLIDSRDADGNKDWSVFPKERFGAYNQKGTSLHDDNQNKGERSLRFRPAANHQHYDEGSYCSVRIHYPGKRDHESQVPIIIKASKSSPIICLTHPFRAKSGASFTIDASSSYTVQHSPLQFHWEQTDGVPVHFEQVGPVLKVRVNPQSVAESAWTALVRALMRHPDFLFSKPPSTMHASSSKERRVLQLVRIAQDLVGRSPTQSELAKLNQGAVIPEMVDQYLDNQEFRDYYFHRIRLYLESQGTILQDEPARLWSYAAFNDLPFSEILTADYTVDATFRKQERPAYHGRTGVLTTKGFIEGKPGLPHYNYAAQVSMLFLGYVFELPPEIAEARDGITAHGTTDPGSACYSCHKILTPLALQRGFWTDDGTFRTKDEDGSPIRADDHGWVDEYPFKGVGMEAFATQAVKKERFIRTMINTHFNFYFGRSMRYLGDERAFYKRLWDNVHNNQFQIRSMIHAIICSPEYLGTHSQLKVGSTK